MDNTKEQLKQIGQILFNENSWSQQEIDELELKLDDILGAVKQVNVDLDNIGQQRELLKALYKKHDEETGYISMSLETAEGYLKSLL